MLVGNINYVLFLEKSSQFTARNKRIRTVKIIVCSGDYNAQKQVALIGIMFALPPRVMWYDQSYTSIYNSGMTGIENL